MLKKVFFILNFICIMPAVATIGSVKVFADNDEIKIAIIDVQKVFENSNVAKDAKKKIDNKEKMIQKDMLDRKKKLENDFKSLESKRSVLSATELQKKAQSLESNYQKLQIEGSICAEALTLTKGYAYETIRKRINSTAQAMTGDKRNKYDLVVSNEFIFYYKSNKIKNITNDIINKMNKNLETIDVDGIYEKTKKDIKDKIEGQRK